MSHRLTPTKSKITFLAHDYISSTHCYKQAKLEYDPTFSFDLCFAHRHVSRSVSAKGAQKSNFILLAIYISKETNDNVYSDKTTDG